MPSPTRVTVSDTGAAPDAEPPPMAPTTPAVLIRLCEPYWNVFACWLPCGHMNTTSTCAWYTPGSPITHSAASMVAAAPANVAYQRWRRAFSTSHSVMYIPRHICPTLPGVSGGSVTYPTASGPALSRVPGQATGPWHAVTVPTPCRDGYRVTP